MLYTRQTSFQSTGSFARQTSPQSFSFAQGLGGLSEGSQVSLRSTAPKGRWIGVSWIMLADVVGTSVLTLGYVAAQLGWILVIVFLVVALVLAIYTADIMSKTHGILRPHGFSIGSMGEAAFYTLGGRPAAVMVFIVVYGYAFLGNSTYLLVLGESLQGAWCGSDSCSELPRGTAVIISACSCLPFLCLVRKVSESTYLCFANLLIILVVLGIVLGSLISAGRESNIQSPLVADDLSFQSLFGASTNILYAYAGHWLYFELMHGMEEPKTFPLVFLVNAPVQALLYIGTTCVAYYFVGISATSAGLQSQMPPGDFYRAAQGMLFAHVGIVFLVKSVVLTRFLVMNVSPESEASKGRRAWLIHIACSIVLLSLSIALALFVPYFTLFLGLIGGLFAAPISYVFPLLFYCGALGRFSAADPALQSQGLEEEIPPFSWKRLRDALTVPQYFIFPVLLTLAMFVTCVGTYNQIDLIIQESRKAST